MRILGLSFILFSLIWLRYSCLYRDKTDFGRYSTPMNIMGGLIFFLLGIAMIFEVIFY